MSRLFELLLKVAERDDGNAIVYLRLFDDESGSVDVEVDGPLTMRELVSDFRGEDDLIAKLEQALGKDSK